MKVYTQQEEIYLILEKCRQLPGTFSNNSFFVFEHTQMVFAGCYITKSNLFYLACSNIHQEAEKLCEQIEANYPELNEYIDELHEKFSEYVEKQKTSGLFFDAH